MAAMLWKCRKTDLFVTLKNHKASYVPILTDFFYFYAQAEATANDMCQALQQRWGQKAAEKFANLVEQLRQCNKDTLEKLADKMLARQDPSER